MFMMLLEGANDVKSKQTCQQNLFSFLETFVNVQCFSLFKLVHAKVRNFSDF